MTKHSLPIAHRAAYYFAKTGLSGSSYVWKIARQLCRERNGEVVFLPSGFPLIVDNKDWISKTIYEGTYERSLLQFLDKVKLRGTFIDVGANVGVTLWHGVKGCPDSSQFLAFEPSEQCQKSLSLVISQMNYPGNVVKVALGEFSEQRTMFGLNNPTQSGGASLLNNFGLQGEKILVNVCVLDDLLKEYPSLPPVSVLKIDTEGFEEKVLAGSRKLIASNTVGVYVLEVSPSFGPTNWVINLHSKTHTSYQFFRLIEKGTLLKRMKLERINNIENAAKFSDQWNLIIIRKDFLNGFKRDIV